MPETTEGAAFDAEAVARAGLGERLPGKTKTPPKNPARSNKTVWIVAVIACATFAACMVPVDMFKEYSNLITTIVLAGMGFNGMQRAGGGK
jgi:hypothetical protein